jgi:hypothetical protein
VFHSSGHLQENNGAFKASPTVGRFFQTACEQVKMGASRGLLMSKELGKLKDIPPTVL